MNKFCKTLHFCILLGFIFHLPTCSVPVNFYLRNLTEQPASVEVHLSDEEGTLADYAILSSSNVENIYFSSYKKMSPVTGSQRGNSNIYVLDLPAQSTFFVGRGSNFHNGYFTRIIITDSAGSRIILDDNNKDILKRGKTKPNRFYAWYDII